VFNTWHPEDEDVLRFLRIVTDTNRAPVFVHCLHGSDRTGTMIAIYRMAVENWSKEAAIEEMTRGGFGFHRVWRNLVKYLRALDVEDLKRRAAIKP
jgi:protein tyrosine/serine phosphatase